MLCKGTEGEVDFVYIFVSQCLLLIPNNRIRRGLETPLTTEGVCSGLMDITVFRLKQEWYHSLWYYICIRIVSEFSPFRFSPLNNFKISESLSRSTFTQKVASRTNLNLYLILCCPIPITCVTPLLRLLPKFLRTPYVIVNYER